MSAEVNGPAASPPPWTVEADACLIVQCRILSVDLCPPD
jgi:hypothetical protein